MSFEELSRLSAQEMYVRSLEVEIEETRLAGDLPDGESATSVVARRHVEHLCELIADLRRKKNPGTPTKMSWGILA